MVQQKEQEARQTTPTLNAYAPQELLPLTFRMILMFWGLILSSLETFWVGSDDKKLTLRGDVSSLGGDTGGVSIMYWKQ